ncbi:MAG TPA: putative glycolipid-binding domain-containing protein [Candidatus Eisenbacteria bacterium]|nr:putative glycolipid-binding domain-containing protein [Candidatus Eisenbacteria bacterium]
MLAGCIDVDFTASPLTNTLPIPRLGLEAYGAGGGPDPGLARIGLSACGRAICRGARDPRQSGRPQIRRLAGRSAWPL